MKFHAQLSVLAACTLGLTAAATSRADVFDWNNITYAPSSADAQTSLPLGNSANGNNSARIQFTLRNGGAFIPDGTVANGGGAYHFPSSASYSQSTIYTSGGGADAQKSLQIGANFSATTSPSFLVTIFFAQPVVSVSFSFFDVDAATTGTTHFTDRVSAIQGTTNGTGTAVIPTVTNTGSNSNTVSGNSAVGTAANNQNASGGNVLVSFGSTTSFNQLSFVYDNAYTTTTDRSTTQVIGLSNIAFTTVPEPGTMTLLGLGIFGAAGVVLRRRRC